MLDQLQLRLKNQLFILKIQEKQQILYGVK
jgi:hypothetical protein